MNEALRGNAPQLQVPPVARPRNRPPRRASGWTTVLRRVPHGEPRPRSLSGTCTRSTVQASRILLVRLRIDRLTRRADRLPFPRVGLINRSAFCATSTPRTTGADQRVDGSRRAEWGDQFLGGGVRATPFAVTSAVTSVDRASRISGHSSRRLPSASVTVRKSSPFVGSIRVAITSIVESPHDHAETCSNGMNVSPPSNDAANKCSRHEPRVFKRRSAMNTPSTLCY